MINLNREKKKTSFILLITVFLFCENSCQKETIEKTKEISTIYPEDFVDIKIIILDISTEVRYATNNNFMGSPLPGYNNQKILTCRPDALVLARVQEELKVKKLGLKVFDGYRPMRVEQSMIDWIKKEKKNRGYMLEEGYVASKVWKEGKIDHVCGNTFNLTLIDESGKKLDMGTGFDEFSTKAWTANATGTVLSNRLILKTVMEKHGFFNYNREWWHFTFPKFHAQAKDFEI